LFLRDKSIAAGAEGQEHGQALISYNLAMTRHALMLCPRLAEGAAAWDRGEVVGKLSLNGTVLAGTVLAKSPVEWDALRQDPSELFQVLSAIGLPKKHEDYALRSGPHVDGVHRRARHTVHAD